MIKKLFLYASLFVFASIILLTIFVGASSSKDAKYVANIVSVEITEYFDRVERRQILDSNTFTDKLALHTMYFGMIAYGSIFAPEASSVLTEYLYGDGDDVDIGNRYVRNSSVVLEHISSVNNRPGIYINSFRQSRDKRLSYVYNPYHLEISRNSDGSSHYRIYENIVFHRPRTSRGVKTTFWLGNFKVRISDQLVYVIGNCNPVLAYTEWDS